MLLNFFTDPAGVDACSDTALPHHLPVFPQQPSLNLKRIDITSSCVVGSTVGLNQAGLNVEGFLRAHEVEGLIAVDPPGQSGSDEQGRAEDRSAGLAGYGLSIDIFYSGANRILVYPAWLTVGKPLGGHDLSVAAQFTLLRRELFVVVLVVIVVPEIGKSTEVESPIDPLRIGGLV